MFYLDTEATYHTNTATFNKHIRSLQTWKFKLTKPENLKHLPVTASSHFHSNISSADTAAARIQSGYRSHKIRGLYKTISSVHQEANRAQSTIQRQETVDAIRSDEKERLRMNETLMSLLLRLDSVPGSDPTIREARRKVSRRIVGMQEVLDSISEAKDENQWYDDEGQGGGGWPVYWKEAVEEEIVFHRPKKFRKMRCCQPR
ncbi:unnamed protein product [Brassica napus]|uniref:(rape) hypothetical protein n=1 Tax=Brassica napus TaxID=3708 RepID=A0A816V0V9_BRANA|nr:unnamed protein product [Brassica napus]